MATHIKILSLVLPTPHAKKQIFEILIKYIIRYCILFFSFIIYFLNTEQEKIFSQRSALLSHMILACLVINNLNNLVLKQDEINNLNFLL